MVRVVSSNKLHDNDWKLRLLPWLSFDFMAREFIISSKISEIVKDGNCTPCLRKKQAKLFLL